MTRVNASSAFSGSVRPQLGLLMFAAVLAIAPISATASGPADTLSAGSYHTCRVRTDSTAACFGYNPHGGANAPAGAFTAISAGYTHSCGIRNDGTAVCWGSNPLGESTAPAGTFKEISAGNQHSCGIRSDGTLACWGKSLPNMPSGTFNAVSSGGDSSCAIRSDGTLVCWGFSAIQMSPPAGTFVALSVDQNHSCALRSDGAIACWGYNATGDTVPPAGSFIAVSAGYDHSCGVRSDGSLVCWGSFTGIPPAGDFVAVSSGEFHRCALRSDATIACWGTNQYGGAPQPALQPSVLPDGSTGAAYGQQLSLSAPGPSFGPAYVAPSPGFAVTSGALPPGLTVSASGLLSGTPAVGGTFAFTVEGEDANGFTALRSYSVFIDGPTDGTPPVIATSVSGTLGNGGWYTSDVSVSWSISDPESAITSTIGCGPLSLSTDSSGTVFTCTATSAGGTASSSVTIKRDATAPVLSPVVSPSVILLNGSGSITADASDALSGLADEECSALETTTVGNHSATCTATDGAGNTATATVSYAVTYGFIGFMAPVENAPAFNLATAGRTIPFKWHLVDADGAPVTSLGGVTVSATTVNCDGTAVADPVEEYGTSHTGLINHGGGDYQYNWQSPTSYENTCRKVSIDVGDGSVHFALFRFR